MFNGGGAAQSGIQMLLKSMGFDPNDFLAKITQAQKVLLETVTHFNNELQTINARLTAIEALLTKPAAITEGNGPDVNSDVLSTDKPN
jgi:hypothetical protein